MQPHSAKAKALTSTSSSGYVPLPQCSASHEPTLSGDRILSLMPIYAAAIHCHVQMELNTRTCSTLPFLRMRSSGRVNLCNWWAPMNWRISQPNDDDLIVDMCLVLNREDPGPQPVGVDQIRNTLMELRANPARGRIAVLELDGRVEGYAFLNCVLVQRAWWRDLQHR